MPSSKMSCAPEAFRRHAFVHLHSDAWQHAQASPHDTGILRDWIARNHPLIVRRPCLSPDGREVSLGLALPDKRRLSFRIPTATVLQVSPPPLWTGSAWSVEGFSFRTFGSYAWQHLTGLSYVTGNSDIDLLLDLSSHTDWKHWLDRQISLPSTPRIDLEIIFAGNASLNWREYLGPTHDILIKSNDRVWLERKEDVPNLFPA